MSRWLICDSLYCPEAFFCSHLSSYSHYLSEANEDAAPFCLSHRGVTGTIQIRELRSDYDVVFALDGYTDALKIPARVHIAQVACNTEVPRGFDAIISSIPALVEKYKARGDNATFMPLCFDTRARVAGMGVTRDLGCIFIGTTGGNHVRRTQLLEELKDVVTVMPPVFGREYFRTLARAKVVFNPHAEWAHGAVNNMRCFETTGMGAALVTDGEIPWPDAFRPWRFNGTVEDARRSIRMLLRIGFADPVDFGALMAEHTYESRVSDLIRIARSL